MVNSFMWYMMGAWERIPTPVPKAAIYGVGLHYHDLDGDRGDGYGVAHIPYNFYHIRAYKAVLV